MRAVHRLYAAWVSAQLLVLRCAREGRPRSRHGDDPPDLAGRTLFPFPNIHCGVSVENKHHGLPRIEHLLRTPAAVRFLSIEPLLEDLGDLRDYFKTPGMPDRIVKPFSNPIEYLPVNGIDWVIVGGESGHGARPMHPDWARSIRDQCVAAGVAFFFKQWGCFAPWEPRHDVAGVFHMSARDGKIGDQPGFISDRGKLVARADMVPMVKLDKKAAGRILDGRTWDEMPKRETVTA